MTTEELYARIGGDYQAAVGHLRSEALINRLILKFPNDPSLPRLFAAWDAGDEREAFGAAHEAKGMCANLSLKDLANRTSHVTELLRPGNEELRQHDDVDARIRDLRLRYQDTAEVIVAFAKQL